MNPIATVIAEHVEQWRQVQKPLIVGICGTQASGKSTASAQLVEHFTGGGLSADVLSLDDLYLGRAARAELAGRIHPLFATRGPPGTHDVGLGIATLDAVKRGQATLLPRFSKRQDEPFPREEWPLLRAGCDILLFEGWCVGARPQAVAYLIEPVNSLEREKDPDAIWRTSFNAHLAGPTGELFKRIDKLVYLRPPSFEIVHRWRCQQEHEMIANDGAQRAAAAMTDDEVARFIAHYERMTRHMMTEMPDRADLLIQLDEMRGISSILAR